MNYASLSILMNSTRRLMTSLPYMQDEGFPSRSTLDLVAADVQTWRWDRPTSSLATSSRLGRSLSWKSLPLLNAIIGTTPSWSRDWIRNAGLLLWNSLPSNSVKDSSLKKIRDRCWKICQKNYERWDSYLQVKTISWISMNYTSGTKSM